MAVQTAPTSYSQCLTCGATYSTSIGRGLHKRATGHTGYRYVRSATREGR